ncbi:centromere protein O isoform X1 [Anguilla rostrata]|uniref:centromere protein O isoform X1 n=1 Tax=Anguilla rostrata TaxID=7938 RepID=UPI0030CC5B01
MEDARECLGEGVLKHLNVLEVEALALSGRQQLCLQQQSRVDDLRIMVEKLRAHRDMLKARAKTNMVRGAWGAVSGYNMRPSVMFAVRTTFNSLQHLKAVADQRNVDCNEDDISAGGSSRTAQSQLSFLVARRTQVKDLLQAHHFIGGYDVTETGRGKGVYISIATAFEGLYLETYNLELDLGHVVQICRHNIPPFIPLEKLAQVHLQTDLMDFLSALSDHLNAFAGRRQQVCLIQEVLLGSVEVMESNVLFNTIVLMCKDAGENGRAILCTLEYSDLSRYLPTKVTIESEDKDLPSTPWWKESQSLLLCTPAHKAFQALKMKGLIA